MAAARPYQVVVLGATGFTGRLVCEHLARDYTGQVRWAMAGRSAARLEGAKRELARTLNSDDGIKDVPTVVYDARDQASVDAVVSQADVVLSTAGPFFQYGTPVVDAAVRFGTHYADITGETWWVKSLMEAYHYRAAEAGVRIVNFCGYDSIPFDMGSWFVTDYIRRELNKPTAKVTAVIVDSAAGVSGGTIASALQMAALPREVLAATADPYYLNAPPDERAGPDARESLAVRYNPELRSWTCPSVMAAVNALVVRRSWALLGRAWGPSFSYEERMQCGSLPSALVKTAIIGVAGAVLSSRLLQPLVKPLLPKPGDGPSREAMMAASYKNLLVATTHEESGAPPTIVTAEFKGRGDAGYYVTARWLLETALCMALQGPALRSTPGLVQGGVLTPSSSCGGVLLERLRAAGTEFEVTNVRAP